ncbi:hypothetical protein BH20ACT4_BH20ACT4_06010 [soil metagenome]
MVASRSVSIDASGGSTLEGDLVLPDAAAGIIVFAHGTGSSRHSPRNRSVAEHLQQRGLATLLIDLLTAEEEHADLRGGQLRFDVELLASRLAASVDWMRRQPGLDELPLGYFGASTGAAAALIAAADRPAETAAVVSRGGRPDLAGSSLGRVRCPTLLIVGGDDPVVLELNQRALTELAVEASLEVVPGATHLFEEPGALEVVADLATHWFLVHVAGIDHGTGL